MSTPWKHSGIYHIFKALGYSWDGLKAAWRHETAFRQEIGICVVAIPLGLWLGEGAVEKALLVGSLLLVLLVELINSAIEAVVDRHGVEHHDLSGRAKDLGSAAVLVSILISTLVWGLILFL